nr:hypothetical protein [Pseudoalteromonas sp. S409]
MYNFKLPINCSARIVAKNMMNRYQLSAISYQLSAISYQLSAISYQLKIKWHFIKASFAYF